MLPRFLLLAGLAMTAGGCGRDATAGCFLPEATPPVRATVLADPRLGASARDLATALFDRDLDRAATLLRGDPALANSAVGDHHTMLAVGLATCDPEAVSLLLGQGARPDGDGSGVPLGLALMATDPSLADALLRGGASVTPPRNLLGPFRTAIATGSIGAVRLLLDHGGDPDVADRLGHRPLLIALDMERFRIAELLLDRGANAWAIDSTGGNLGTAVHMPMVTTEAEEADAQRRLRARLSRVGWPAPPPPPADIRSMAVEGRWPPADVRAPALSPDLRKVITETAANR